MKTNDVQIEIVCRPGLLIWALWLRDALLSIRTLQSPRRVRHVRVCAQAAVALCDPARSSDLFRILVNYKKNQRQPFGRESGLWRQIITQRQGGTGR